VRPTASANNEDSTSLRTVSTFSQTTRCHITENSSILGRDAVEFGRWVTSFLRNLMFHLQDSNMDAQDGGS
jgi:hypothetical protein